MTEKTQMKEGRSIKEMTEEEVQASVNQSVADGHIDTDQADVLLWLHKYSKDNDLPNSALADRIKVSDGSLSQVYSGTYAAKSWSNIIEKIAAFKESDDGFIETSTVSTVFNVCESAINDEMPAFVYGASQIGKTTALEAFMRTHHIGKVKYIRLGSRWTKSRLVRELAAVCKVKTTKRHYLWELEEAIYDSLNGDNLLIIDEFHLAMETVSDETSREIVEFIREIFDRTHCGLVLSSTDVGRIDLEEGKNHELFDQLRRRGVVKVVLPKVPPVKDINAIARRFGLDLPSGDVLKNVKELLKSRGLGVFIKFLKKTKQIVGGGAMKWEKFFYVNDGYAALANMKDEY